MPAPGISKDLSFTPPLDWATLLSFFRTRAVDGLEQVTENCYIRRYDQGDHGDQANRISVHCDTDRSTLTITGLASTQAADIKHRIRNLFDLEANPQAVAQTLRRTRSLEQALPDLDLIRVPGAWDLFEIGVRAILGQQVTVAGARTLSQRLIQRFADPSLTSVPSQLGLTRFPSPDRLAKAPIVEIGMPSRRAEAIQRFARLMSEAPTLHESASDFSKELLAIPGIGPWTVNYIRMRGLKDPDAFPEGDIALLRAAQHLGIAETMKDLQSAAEAWRPYRAYATIALWRVLSNKAKS